MPNVMQTDYKRVGTYSLVSGQKQQQSFNTHTPTLPERSQRMGAPHFTQCERCGYQRINYL